MGEREEKEGSLGVDSVLALAVLPHSKGTVYG